MQVKSTSFQTTASTGVWAGLRPSLSYAIFQVILATLFGALITMAMTTKIALLRK